MKRLVFIMIFFLLPSVFAISLNTKEVYQPSETLIVEISGNILEPIEKENVVLKRNNVQVPWDYDIKRLGNAYFMYGVLPNNENNYTLFINDVTTTVNGRPETVDFNTTIVVQGPLVDYYLKPAIFNTLEDFEVEVFLNKDSSIPVSISHPETHEVTLSPGSNLFSFNVDSFQNGLTFLQIGMYSIPVYTTREAIDNSPRVRFFPVRIESTILIDEFPIYPITIINDEEFNVNQLTFIFDEELFVITPVFPNSLESNQAFAFNLSLRKANTPIDEIIVMRLPDGRQVELLIDVDYTSQVSETETPYLEEDYSESNLVYCSDLNGKACTAGEVCSSDTVQSLDRASCCLGECVAPAGRSYAWIGYLIGAIILIILVIIGARYLKTRTPKELKVTS